MNKITNSALALFIVLYSSCINASTNFSGDHPPDLRLYFKSEHDAILGIVQASTIVYKGTTHLGMADYEPVDSGRYWAVAFNLTKGSSVDLGFVDELYLRVLNDYYYVSIDQRKGKRDCWGLLPNGSQEPVVLFSETGLRFLFKEGLTKSQAETCRKRNKIENLSINNLDTHPK